MSRDELPNGDINDLVDTVTGYADGFERARQRYKLEVEELEELLLDENIQQCEGCNWYVEAGELVDEQGVVNLCESCREKY